MNKLLRPIRLYFATRFFMKHWEVNRTYARVLAETRIRYLERKSK